MGTLMDVITIYIVPIGAILGAIMAYWVLGIDKMEQELMTGRSKPLSRAFAPLARGKPVKRQLLGILIGHNARVTHAPTPVSS